MGYWSERGRQGQVIARARSSATGTWTTNASLSGLSITFDVLAGEEVEVELDVPAWYGDTALMQSLFIISDGSDVAKQSSYNTLATSGKLSQARTTELITAAGSYTRKGRVLKSGATGTTFSYGLTAAEETQLKATVVKAA